MMSNLLADVQESSVGSLLMNWATTTTVEGKVAVTAVSKIDDQEEQRLARHLRVSVELSASLQNVHVPYAESLAHPQMHLD